MSDDAQFDAFLKGEGDLSRRLQAMPAGEPSAELDAAILNRARLALAQEAHPMAANDPGDMTTVPRLARPFGHRWRVPVGIAATLLAGVFANQAFQSEKNHDVALVAETAAPSPVLIIPSADAVAEPTVALAPQAPMMDSARAPAAAPASPPPPPPLARKERALAGLPAPAATSKPAMPVQDAPAVAAAPAPAPAPVAAAAPPAASSGVPVTVESFANAAPAPQANLAARQRSDVAENEMAEAKKSKALARGEIAERITITGSANKRLDSKTWLAQIERLLKEGDNDNALLQWQGFRNAYPREKVAPELEARLDALDK